MMVSRNEWKGIWDMTKYIDCDFVGSEAWKSAMYCDKECLKNVESAMKGAINFHTKEGNIGQIKFFSDGLELVQKRIKKELKIVA